MAAEDERESLPSLAHSVFSFCQHYLQPNTYNEGAIMFVIYHEYWNNRKAVFIYATRQTLDF